MTASEPRVCIHEIRWNHGHYRPPPDGLPEVLARYCFVESPPGGWTDPPALCALINAHGVPWGYGYHVRTLRRAAPRRFTAAQRATVRRQRLRRRLETKAPLFADELEQRELADQPGYYAGEQDADQRDFIAASDAQDRALFQEALDRAGLQVFCAWWREPAAAGLRRSRWRAWAWPYWDPRGVVERRLADSVARWPAARRLSQEEAA